MNKINRKFTNINKNDFDGNIVFGGHRFHEITNRFEAVDSVVNENWGSEFFEFNGSELKRKEGYFETFDKCLSCTSNRLKSQIVKKGLVVSQCLDCTFGFQNPRVKKQHIDKLYTGSYIMDDVYSSEAAKVLDRIKYLYGIQNCLKHVECIDSVLDVGCGGGYSLDVYEEAGINTVFGIDPSVDVETNESRRILQASISKVPPSYINISLITLWDTLEHIHDFKEMLSSCHAALKTGGLILIMVPNFLSLASRLIRERSPMFQIDHINYFTTQTLEDNVKKVGFSICSTETVISEIDNCRNYLEFQEPYSSVPKREKAFEWLTPEYIHSNMLGSRILLIAKKH